MRVRPLHVALLLTVAVLLGAVPALAQHEPSIPSLSNSQLERLAAGEVIVEVITGETPVGEALGIIDAPPMQVMEVLRDFDAYEDWMGDIDSSEIIGQEGEFYICRGVTDTPWPMEDREWTTRSWGGPQTIDGVDVLVASWEYVPGSGNIVNSVGYWLLVPWGDTGNQTLLRYHLMVDLGTWLPDFLLEWSTENFLPSKITDVRARVADRG